jgi:hypothetical protein
MTIVATFQQIDSEPHKRSPVLSWALAALSSMASAMGSWVLVYHLEGDERCAHLDMAGECVRPAVKSIWKSIAKSCRFVKRAERGPLRFWHMPCLWAENQKSPQVRPTPGHGVQSRRFPPDVNHSGSVR